MKKLTALILTLAMVLSLAACSTGSAPGSSTTAKPGSASQTSAPVGEDPLKTTYNFATYSTGTSWYSYGATITDLLTKAGMNLNMLAYGGGLSDLVMVQQGEAPLSLSFSVFSKWSYNGMYAYEDYGANPELRLITGSFDKMYVTIALNAKLGVTSLEEIVDKKMGINIYTSEFGSASEYTTRIILEALGIDYETIESWGGSVTHTDFASIVDAYKDGKCDLFIQHCSVGHPTMTELCTTCDVVLPSLSDEVVAYMTERGYTEMDMPANTFGTHDEVRCAGMVTTMICTTAVPDEVSYLIAKTLYNAKDEMILGHAGFKDFDLEACCLSEGNGEIPLAKGAEQYYREIGLIT